MPELSISELHNILNNLFPIVDQAAESILKIYNTPFNKEIKQDNSPVTKADQKSNKIIIEGLQLITPEFPIISEESKFESYDKRKAYKQCWIVDPLDGTKEFINHNGEFSINIALCADQEIILGIVMAPVSGEIAWAIKGEGAFLKEKNGRVVKLRCGDFCSEQEKLRVVTSRSHLSTKTKQLINELNNPILIKKGSSWKFILIASNQADYYPRPGTTMEWDTAAPQIILEEAGGTVCSIKDNKRLVYNKENLKNPEFIAKGSSNEAD